MKELTLQEIKDVEVELLKRFHSFCIEHNIRYFISHGTLLGAVRYKAFIPWDDDVDVLVPREDYDRLMADFPNQGDIRLVSVEREPRYLFPFAKLCDMSIIKEETGIDNGVELGLNLDVFPLNGPDGDSFYINGVKQNAYQLLEFEGHYYFVGDGHKIAKNCTLYLTNEYVYGTGLKVGYYSFDATGKLILN